MLEHFNADDFIKFLIPARECLRARCDSAKRQAALLQQLQAVGIEFQPSPLMPRSDQGWTIGARPAPYVDDGTAGRQIVEDETQHLEPGFQHRRPGAVNVFPMKQSALLWENYFTKVAFLKKSWNGLEILAVTTRNGRPFMERNGCLDTCGSLAALHRSG